MRNIDDPKQKKEPGHLAGLLLAASIPLLVSFFLLAMVMQGDTTPAIKFWAAVVPATTAVSIVKMYNQ